MSKRKQTSHTMRTCIACGKQACKWQLLRVVRTSNGSAAFDASNKAAGRGAYVCSQKCFEHAHEKHKFDRALRTKISVNTYNTMASDIAAHISVAQNH